MLFRIGRWLFRLCYRVEVKGLDNYYQSGKRTLIVANHTSFLDAALLTLFLPGDFSFAIHTRIVNQWFMKPFRNMFKLFIMDPTNPFSLKSLIKYLKADHKVVIFPEGRITKTGSLMKIYHGTGLVADRSESDVLPIRIDGAQYTPFSKLRGIIRLHWFPKITITILPARKIKAPAHIKGRQRRNVAGQMLTDIMNEMMFATSNYHRTLFDAVIDAEKTHGADHIIANDVERKPLTYRQLIQRSFLLGDFFAKETAYGEYVGVMLPSMCSTLITFMALQSQGRVPAMLNFSTGTKSMLCACETANIKLVYTSRRFVKLAKLEETITELSKNVKVLYLEDIIPKISLTDKIKSLFSAWFARFNYHSRNPSVSPNDPAVILFTSGSEGMSKGVVLSHANLLANGVQMSTRVDFNAQDIILNALPLFHSFGLTAGTLIPLVSGMRVFFYPSPLHYRIIPEVAYDIGATIMFGTNTFLANYARFAHPYDFYSLRYAFAGAEKLQESTRRVWGEKFGVRVFEGYGATETSPALSTNTAMDNKTGSVGRFLPGIEYTLMPVPGVADGGRLMVKGPNIMLGYLLHNAPGVLVPPETELGKGWYDTGDIVTIDDDGFVTIQGRAKRFAKIAGEMVSLTAVEEFIDSLWPDHRHAVIAIADERKGEKLVLVTENFTAERKHIASHAKATGLGEINLPRNIVHIKRLPVLGTGKTDYISVTEFVAKT